MRKGIGIDFGTTNSSIAVAHNSGHSETVQFRTGTGSTDTFRSVLYFEPKKPTVCGPAAIERYLAAEEKGRLIQSLKSFLASRLFTSTAVFERSYTLEDLIAIILRELCAQAAPQIGGFQNATIVVGRPVRYSSANNEEDNNFALDRLKRALERAGIGAVLFEYEPVAAAYYYESTLDHDELIMIGDFGGGTSDFSLLKVGPAARRAGTHRILGTEGVALAGDAFDARVVRNLVALKLGRGSEFRSLDKILPMPEWVYTDLERWHYLSFLKSSDTLQMLRSIRTQSLEPEKISALLHIIQEDLGFYLHQSVQALKLELSGELEGSFHFEDYAIQMHGKVKRKTFEGWIDGDLEKIRGCVQRLISAAGVAEAEIDRVFLTGGSSLVPAVRRIFADRFGAHRISSGSEFTSVAKGLALRAYAE